MRRSDCARISRRPCILRPMAQTRAHGSCGAIERPRPSMHWFGFPGRMAREPFPHRSHALGRASTRTRAIEPACGPPHPGKRLPIVLRELGIATPTWDSVLPPTRAVGLRALAPQLVRDDEVLKPIWGRVGDGVAIEGVTPLKEWRRSRILARIFPKAWVLQRRFESQPLVDGSGEPFHACVGVYVIDGRAAAYARIARRPLIDGRARDAAVLVDRALDPSGATLPELAVPTSPSRDRAHRSQSPRGVSPAAAHTASAHAASAHAAIPNEVHHASH